LNVVTVVQESRAVGNFYVPRFEIRIEGEELPDPVIRDITQLTYKDNIKEIDGFELTVNNWDAAANDFKYVGAEPPKNDDQEAKDRQTFRERLFEPCNKKVSVRMGYGDKLVLMLTGTFTTMEPNFPAAGAPTLAVRGLNVLHQLRRKQYTTSWPARHNEKITDSQIAKEIAGLKDKDTKRKRFPLPIETDPTAAAQEPTLTYVAQKNQYDIDFLMVRARERGYVIVIEEKGSRGPGSPELLYFGPSDGGKHVGLRDVTFELEWGKTLIDFKPTLTTANQIKSVTVNGWDRKTKQPIAETVTLDDPKLTKNKDLHELLQKCDPREEYVVDEPYYTKDEARKRAIALLMDRSKEIVKASGTTIGLPDLRAGKFINIRNLGSRFSGTYFITESTHTINASGYITKFNARREDEGTKET
jgi:phage protein D